MQRFFAFLLMSAVEPAERSQNLDDLLSCIAQGDRSALATLYHRTSAHLYGVVLLIHDADHALAAEVLQDVYVQVWQTAGRYDVRFDHPLTWLVGIARQRAIDMRRLRQPPAWTENDASGKAPLSDAAPSEVVCMAMLARASRRSANALAPLEQQSFGLAYYLGLSTAEVAAQLREPLATIKACLRRALPALRQCTEQQKAGAPRAGT
jgi:RNA polymerase sigma-70 factor (ECF subfamily)